jgi:GTPase SAR1 family protein
MKQWNRSKVMIVGEGRTGKTSLVNSVLGNPAVSPESTCGIGQYSASLAGKDGGQWRLRVSDAGSSFVDAVAEVVKEAHLHERGFLQGAHISGSKGMKDAAATDFFDGAASSVSSAAPSAVQQGFSSLSTTGAVSTGVQPSRYESLDMAPVLQQYYRRLSQNSDIIVKLFDLGGQEVFDCVHTYFMTEQAVYVVVFNMATVADVATRTSSMATLSFWLNAVSSKNPDCIFIVGSHKDIVPDAEQHQYISELLRETFRLCAAWPAIILNDALTFFPVNNNLGIEDPDVRNLILKMEDRIQQSDIVKTLASLAWYRALDTLGSLPSIVPYAVAHAATVSCGVAEDTVCELFAFLRDMGCLMWYNEGSLKDYVIMNAVDAFVTPITRIICLTGEHNKEAYTRCKQLNEDDFGLMVARGVVSPKLLKDLLNYEATRGNNKKCGRDADDHSAFLVALAVKYRLLVPWTVEGGLPKSYFVPSLFAHCGSGSRSNIETDMYISRCRSKGR